MKGIIVNVCRHWTSNNVRNKQNKEHKYSLRFIFRHIKGYKRFKTNKNLNFQSNIKRYQKENTNVTVNIEISNTFQ